MEVPKTRAEARERVKNLVEQFRSDVATFTKGGSTYNETQVRTEFITPFLVALGWDVFNKQSLPLDQREVIEEATVAVHEEEERLSKKPDYEFRLARQRKFFVEAKKPSVHVDRDKKPAFQVRRYGFSASVPISVLTNFHQLAIYDCIPTPNVDDDPHVARVDLYSFEQYEERFDEIYDKLSREAVYSGRFDEIYRADITRQGTAQFDGYFLEQVRSWRKRLAESVHEKNPGLSASDLAYVVQLILSRLVFLRICEDREIEKYESLKELGDQATYDAFKTLLVRADERYNSGLFRLIDDPSLSVNIPADVFFEIIGELYYPKSPYTFAVVEANVLGEIYEQFLGEELEFSGSTLKVVPKPEVKESGGVVTTPQYVVDAIVERALTPALAGKSPADLKAFRVADISCGSGIFLLAAYDKLLSHHLTWYQNEATKYRGKTIFESVGGQWRLSLEEKCRIVLDFIYGVDIDSQAVDVARFSLLLKLIEDERAVDIESYISRHGKPALPSLDDNIRCGNSLVDHASFDRFMPTATNDVLDQVNPMTWKDEFPAIMANEGFDVILGNPPYIRIQNMVAYSPEEARFYQSSESSYSTASADNFDKYALFLERGLALLNPQGWLGYIVPNKFCTLTSGRALRRLISKGKHLKDVVHFGAQQVFGKKSSNYTCVLGLHKLPNETVTVERVKDLARWKYGDSGEITVRQASEFGEEAWQFLGDDVGELFKRLKSDEKVTSLKEVADIFVGVQTSDDEIYIVMPKHETASTVTFDDVDGKEWTIEKGILRPFLHDVTLTAYSRPAANKYIIFPYKLGGKRAELIPPSEMQTKFKKTWGYLSAHKARLEDRSITGGSEGSAQWYQFGRSQSLTKFNTPKIILPILSLEPKYTYDDSNMVVSGGGNGPYYLVRPKDGSGMSIFYLLAVLCHPLNEAKVRSRTSVFRGGYYSHGKQFIEDLFVPKIKDDASKAHDKVVGLVEKMLQVRAEAAAAVKPATRTGLERRLVALRAEVEATLNERFELTDLDVETIQGVDVPV